MGSLVLRRRQGLHRLDGKDRGTRFPIVRSGFVVQATLLGQRGATQRFTALIVPPSIEGRITPSPTTGIAEEFSAIRRTRSKSD